MSQQTLLLVEDDEDLIELLNLYFLKKGFRLIVARSGNEALELAQKFPPEVVILDMRIPGIDGFEVCRHLKNEPATRDFPILCISASFREPHQIARALDLGADDYLLKPFDLTELNARVSTLLRLRNQHRKIIEQQFELSALSKKAAMVELAGAVAHEVNNPLTLLIGQASLLEKELEGGAISDKARRYLRIMSDAAHRIADIIKKVEKLENYRTTKYGNHKKIIDLN